MTALDRAVNKLGIVRRRIIEIIRELNTIEGIDRRAVEELYEVVTVLNRVEDRLIDSYI